MWIIETKSIQIFEDVVPEWKFFTEVGSKREIKKVIKKLSVGTQSRYYRKGANPKFKN